MRGLTRRSLAEIRSPDTTDDSIRLPKIGKRKVMAIKLNMILSEAGLNLADVRLLRHKDQRAISSLGTVLIFFLKTN